MASIFKQQYTAKGKDGTRIKKKSKFWYIDYKGVDGIRKRVKGFKDKTATAQLAAKLEKEAELAEVGIVDRYKEHRKRPLAEHIEDFRESMLAKGGTVRHVEVTLSRITRIVEGCKFVMWDDVSASRTQNLLAQLRKSEPGISRKTSNYYLQSIKQFCSWMVQDARSSESPLKHLKKLSTCDDDTQKRRALEPDEFGRLLEVTELAPKRFGMEGHERAVMYRFAAYTGLRANEIRNLTASSFDFDNSTVKVKAAYSKRRREDVLALRKDTVEAMREFLGGKTPKARAFNMPSEYRTASMIRADLTDAGIGGQDNDDGVLDFHSLRHTTASLLAAAGVNPKTAQAIMRHSDINLTMSRYSHVFRGAESDAVESMPDFSSKGRQRQAATGTDGKPSELTKIAYKPAYKKLTKTAYSGCDQSATIGTHLVSKRQQKNPKGNGHKSSDLGTLGAKKEPLSSTDNDSNMTGPGRTRTYDKWIMSPLL